MNPFIGKSCGQALDLITNRFADREALVFADRRWSYRDVGIEVERAARRLGSLGLPPGAHVAIWLPNRPELLWYWLAAASHGLVAVLLNTRLAREEAAYQIRQSHAAALIIPGAGSFRDFAGDLALAGDFPDLATIITLDKPPAGHDTLTNWSKPADEADTGPPPPQVSDPDQPCTILYSSGTTALPKGILLTHHLWRKAFDGAARMGVGADDKMYLCVPLFGIMALVNGLLSLWVRGGSVILEERFEAGACLATLVRENTTGILLVPTMVRAILTHPDLPTTRHRLRFGGAVTSDVAELKEIAARLGLRDLINSYGMTETGGVAVRTRFTEPLDDRLATHGPPMPGIAVQIIDPEDSNDPPAPLPPGSEGEILIRGYSITPGYYDQPDDTAAAFTRDGWFRTGDRGRLDRQGRLTYLGRLKDGYKHKGFNVSTAEVEVVIARHPAVTEVKVVGLPHPLHGAVGAAFVVARRPLDQGELDDFLRPLLAGFKRPAHLFTLDHLPTTAGTGKVQIAALLELAQARLSQTGDKG